MVCTPHHMDTGIDPKKSSLIFSSLVAVRCGLLAAASDMSKNELSNQILGDIDLAKHLRLGFTINF